MKKEIRTNDAPAAIGPYSQAVSAGRFLFTSGQLGIDPATGDLREGVEAQTRQVFENLKNVLAAGGAQLADVVKSTVFLSDIGNFTAVNAIYAEYFEGLVMPARSAFEVAKLPKGALVEIEMIAVLE